MPETSDATRCFGKGTEPWLSAETSSRRSSGGPCVAFEVENGGRVWAKGVAQEEVPSWGKFVAESPRVARRRQPASIRPRKGGMLLAYLMAACIFLALCLWAWSGVLAVQKITPRLRGSTRARSQLVVPGVASSSQRLSQPASIQPRLYGPEPESDGSDAVSTVAPTSSVSGGSYDLK
mmetsp:Transcript_49221/g.117143  ORF Transcript_49221/g.117143 Transcript_49221/m.117143 type:complete len:178 (-) Transcript_49221:79-612(-)